VESVKKVARGSPTANGEGRDHEEDLTLEVNCPRGIKKKWKKSIRKRIREGICGRKRGTTVKGGGKRK